MPYQSKAVHPPDSIWISATCGSLIINHPFFLSLMHVNPCLAILHSAVLRRIFCSIDVLITDGIRINIYGKDTCIRYSWIGAVSSIQAFKLAIPSAIWRAQLPTWRRDAELKARCHLICRYSYFPACMNNRHCSICKKAQPGGEWAELQQSNQRGPASTLRECGSPS